MISSIMKSLGKARSATAEGLDALDLIREGVAAKAAEIEQIRRAPLPVAEALARFDSWADQVATRAIDAMEPGRLADPSAHGSLRIPKVSMPGQIVPDSSDAVEAVLGLVLLSCRPQIKATIKGQLSDLLVGRETFTDAERMRRIAEAERQLHQALALEEIAVRQLEEAGVSVSRRADALPEVVLLTDASLARLAG